MFCQFVLTGWYVNSDAIVCGSQHTQLRWPLCAVLILCYWTGSFSLICSLAYRLEQNGHKHTPLISNFFSCDIKCSRNCAVLHKCWLPSANSAYYLETIFMCREKRGIILKSWFSKYCGLLDFRAKLKQQTKGNLYSYCLRLQCD